MYFALMVGIPDLAQGSGGYVHLLDPPAGFTVALSGGWIQRGEPSLLDVEEDPLSSLYSNGHLEVHIQWTELPQQFITGPHGLQIDAVPTPLIEGLGHRMHVWIEGTHIDVAAIRNMLERAPEDRVFVVLGEGNEGHSLILCLEVKGLGRILVALY